MSSRSIHGTDPKPPVQTSSLPPIDPISNVARNKKPPSSQSSKSTDDHRAFTSASVRSSILKVANEIVSGGKKSFWSDSNRTTTTTTNVLTKTSSAEESDVSIDKFNSRRRRSSQSLPSSPLNSRKMTKNHINKYFTQPFDSESDRTKGWILSSLLAKRRTSRSMGFIGPNETSKSTEDLIESKSLASSTDTIDGKQKCGINKSHLEPKPSELREMNFWSPTSL